MLGDAVPLGAAVQQAANVGALVASLFRHDRSLMSRALEDHIAEPRRAHLVPMLDAVKRAAAAAGAIGCGLSGSGPSIFALSGTFEGAHAVGDAMRTAFTAASDVRTDLWISPVGARGARIVAT